MNSAALAIADPVAFLSYAHAESALAQAFGEALSNCGVAVVVDKTHLQPGEDITTFARGSIASSDATIVVVSSVSLSSSWVVFEAVTSLHKAQLNPAARLIACATDLDFMSDQFHLTTMQSVDDRIASLDGQVVEYVTKKLDLQVLAVERSRLLKMRASFGELLEWLRGSLTLTLRADALGEAAARVGDYLRSLRGQAPSRMDRRDVRARAEQLRRYLWDGSTDDALSRLLDFVTDFSGSSQYRRDATLISNTLRRIERAEKEGKIDFNQAEEQRQPMIGKFLDLIDALEIDPQLPMAS